MISLSKLKNQELFSPIKRKERRTFFKLGITLTVGEYLFILLYIFRSFFLPLIIIQINIFTFSLYLFLGLITFLIGITSSISLCFALTPAVLRESTYLNNPLIIFLVHTFSQITPMIILFGQKYILYGILFMLIIPYVLFFVRYYNEGINAENYRKIIETRIIRNLQILGPATLHSINRLTRIKKEIIELVVLSLKEKDMISTFDIEHFQKQNGIILKSWKKA